MNKLKKTGFIFTIIGNAFSLVALIYYAKNGNLDAFIGYSCSFCFSTSLILRYLNNE